MDENEYDDLDLKINYWFGFVLGFVLGVGFGNVIGLF